MKALRGSSAWVLTVIGGICLGVGGASMVWSQPKTTGLPKAVLKTPTDLSMAFRDAAHHVLPAVVSITSRVKGGVEIVSSDESASPEDQFGNDEMLRRFFGERFGEINPGGRGPQRRYVPPQLGSGSGVIVDASGIVLTNSHVVASADEVVVELGDGRQFKAKSWATDPRRDVAIVKIEADEELPTAALGDSDQAQIGDWVLALGNPFNVGTSVTAGIVSATGRSTRINELESYIQTDAAVNPGNSGGPLINLNGEVIGINTAISTNSGGYDGVSFAIPVNIVRGIADQLIKTGKVERSYLGVALKALTPDLREYYKAKDGGALVILVKPDAPAAKAGVKVGDVIIELAEKPIHNSEVLTWLVEGLPAGKPQKMVVLRKGERVEIDVTLEEMPEDYTEALKRVRPAKSNGASAEEKSVLGLKVMNLSDEVASQLAVPEGTTGVVVKDVEVGGPAFEAGLRRGDVISSVDDKPVTSLSEFEEVVKSADLTTGVMLHVVRRGSGDLILLKSEK